VQYLVTCGTKFAKIEVLLSGRLLELKTVFNKTWKIVHTFLVTEIIILSSELNLHKPD